RRGADDRRDATAEGFLHTKTVSIVMSWTDQHIGCGKQFGNALGEAKQFQPGAHAILRSGAAPNFDLSARPGRKQINIPVRVAAEHSPRFEEHVESLVAIE